MKITVPRNVRGHFWEEPPADSMEFWAFQYPVKAQVGDPIYFMFDGACHAMATIHSIEAPGVHSCDKSGKYLNMWKVFWTQESFHDLRIDHGAPYYIVSTKWTHRRDGWFTLWGPNCCGYDWWKERAGVYTGDHGYGNSPDTIAHMHSVPKELADSLMIDIDYWGETKRVLPNEPEVRKMLGIQLANCTASARKAYLKGE